VRLLSTSSVLAALVLGCSHAETPSPGGAMPAAAVAPQDPVVAFQTVRAVLQDPRCQNCHPATDRPLQTDTGFTHAMNVQRGPEGHGMTGAECTTCHGKANPPASYGPHQPPGVASTWRMPPPEQPMVFVGRSPRELCEQLKDPKRNGHMTMDNLLHHVSGDPLVLWGWAPGTDRRPVSVPHAEFVAAFKRWSDAGGPCPP